MHEARSALESVPELAHYRITLESDNDTLLLRGEVAQFYHKQLAQEAVRPVINGTKLINSIRVTSS